MVNLELVDFIRPKIKPVPDIENFEAFKNVNRINLSFNNITYVVRKHVLSLEKKTVLQNVSGKFKAGELTAIMGPSGAGKSCLMNILASYITGREVTGEIKVNGKKMQLASYRPSIAYIMQDDHLHPRLTVFESMLIAAELKLHGSRKFMIKRVQFIIKLLGLKTVSTTFTEDLSGGQRKRLVIAFELIGESSVMFFDEPTSHLDSSTSKQCVEILKSLAKSGRNIICTIHQPSATLMNMFDHLYVVAKGHCVYDGHIPDMLPFFKNLGFHCPSHYNPSDFMIDIVNGEYGDNTLKFAEATKLLNNYTTKTTDLSENETTDEQIEIIGSPSSFWTQFCVLLHSNLLRIYRSRDLLMTIILSHLGMAIVVGFLFLDVGKNAERMFDNAKLTFFNLLFISLCAVSMSLLSFPGEIPALVPQAFNNWYSVHTLFLAKNLAFSIISLTCSIVYIIIMFFMTNQFFEWDRFSLVILQCLLMGILSLSIGTIFGAAFSPKASLFLAFISLLPQVLLSGFFIRCRDTFEFIQIWFDYSIYKRCFDGLMLATYGYDRKPLECSGFCISYSPSLMLKEFDMQNADYWNSTGYLIMCYITATFVAYLIVVYRLKR